MPKFYSVKGSGYVRVVCKKTFTAKYSKEIMRASIRLAIHWYVFVNKMVHADILEQKK